MPTALFSRGACRKRRASASGSRRRFRKRQSPERAEGTFSIYMAHPLALFANVNLAPLVGTGV